MSFIEKRQFVYLATIGSISMWAYFIGLDLTENPRMLDHQLTHDEMYWWEFLITIQGLFLTFAILVSSVRHSFKNFKKYWGVLMLLIWPLSFVYAWVYGRTS